MMAADARAMPQHGPQLRSRLHKSGASNLAVENASAGTPSVGTPLTRQSAETVTSTTFAKLVFRGQQQLVERP